MHTCYGMMANTKQDNVHYEIQKEKYHSYDELHCEGNSSATLKNNQR